MAYMTEYQKFLEAMAALPEGLREAAAAEFRHELAERQQDPLANLTPAQEEHLRRLIQQGLDSGPATPLDMQEILQEAHRRWEASRRQAH